MLGQCPAGGAALSTTPARYNKNRQKPAGFFVPMVWEIQFASNFTEIDINIVFSFITKTLSPSIRWKQ